MFYSQKQILREAFFEWLGSETPADKVLQKVYKSQRAGSSDRRQVGEVFYKLLRYYPAVLGITFSGKSQAELSKFDDFVEALSLEGDDLDAVHEKAKPRFSKSARDHLAKIHGLDLYLFDEPKASSETLECFHQTLHALAQSAPVFLRLRSDSVQEVEREFREAGVEFVKSNFAPLCRILKKRDNIQNLKSFREGRFEVQDLSSQVVAPLMQVEEGMRVLDFCAGAGGKTLHLLDEGPANVELWVHDSNPKKLKNLEERRIRNVLRPKVQFFDPRINEEVTFDRILLDVPCSGLGTLRRSPDQIYRMNQKKLRSIETVQKRIVQQALAWLKPGGKLVYSTCTFRHAENAAQLTSAAMLEVEPIDAEAELGISWGANAASNFLTLTRQSPVSALAKSYFLELGLTLGPKLSDHLGNSQLSGDVLGDGFFVARLK